MITAVISLYFNCFVLVVQAFAKVSTLHALAPKGQRATLCDRLRRGSTLIVFVILGYLAVRRYRGVGAN